MLPQWLGLNNDPGNLEAHRNDPPAIGAQAMCLRLMTEISRKTRAPKIAPQFSGQQSWLRVRQGRLLGPASGTGKPLLAEQCAFGRIAGCFPESEMANPDRGRSTLTTEGLGPPARLWRGTLGVDPQGTEGLFGDG